MTDAAAPCPAPKARDGSSSDDRRQRIILVAMALFLEKGFARTSMSQIAATVGGSKTTLWSYFTSKNDLFMAVADHVIERYFDPVERHLAQSHSLTEDLHRIGRSMLAAAMSPEISGLIRIATAEAKHFTELGAMFHDRGLGRGWQVIAAYLDRAKRDGQLVVDCDTAVAARQFISLCQAHWYQMVLLGGALRPTQRELDADVDAAVDTFTRAFCR